MADSKTILSSAEEKMDMAIMYNGYGNHVSGRCFGTYPRRKSRCTSA